jgi:hypothetical protein
LSKSTAPPSPLNQEMPQPPSPVAHSDEQVIDILVVVPIYIYEVFRKDTIISIYKLTYGGKNIVHVGKCEKTIPGCQRLKEEILRTGTGTGNLTFRNAVNHMSIDN